MKVVTVYRITYLTNRTNKPSKPIWTFDSNYPNDPPKGKYMMIETIDINAEDLESIYQKRVKSAMKL